MCFAPRVSRLTRTTWRARAGSSCAGAQAVAPSSRAEQASVRAEPSIRRILAVGECRRGLARGSRRGPAGVAPRSNPAPHRGAADRQFSASDRRMSVENPRKAGTRRPTVDRLACAEGLGTSLEKGCCDRILASWHRSARGGGLLSGRRNGALSPKPESGTLGSLRRASASNRSGRRNA